MSIIELLHDPLFNRISSSFEKSEPGNGKFAELLNDQVDTKRSESERAEHPVKNNEKIGDLPSDEYESSSTKDDYSGLDHEVDREEYREEYTEHDDRPNSSGHRQSDEGRSQTEEKPSDSANVLTVPENTEKPSAGAATETPISVGMQKPETTEPMVATAETVMKAGQTAPEAASTVGAHNRSQAMTPSAATSDPLTGLARAAQVQKQDIPVGLERARYIQSQTSQISANAGIEIPISPTADAVPQSSTMAKADLQTAPQKNAATLPQQSAVHTKVNLEADNLPALRNHTAIAQLLQQEKPVEITSLIQYFQAKMGQNPGANNVDTGSLNTANQTSANLVETMKSMMGQSSTGGQMGSQGQNSQYGSPLGAAVSGLASSQTNLSGNGQASFASTMGIDGVGVGVQGNSLQVQQAAQIANMPAPSHAATNMQSPTVQIGFQIAKAVDQGINRMSIRLDPAELGRVQIQLEVGGDGRVQAMIMADKQDTLDLLQKDARMLEKVLKDAGLETSSEDLSFSLQQGNQNQWASGRSENFGRSSPDKDSGDDVPLASNEYEQPDLISDRALDVRV